MEAKATERDRRPLRMRHCSVAELLLLRTATLKKYSAGEHFPCWLPACASHSIRCLVCLVDNRALSNLLSCRHLL